MFTVCPTHSDEQDKRQSSKNSCRFYIFGIKNFKKDLFGKQIKSLTLRLLIFYIYIYIYIYIYMEHPFLMFLDHTQRRSTVSRTPLDE